METLIINKSLKLSVQDCNGDYDWSVVKYRPIKNTLSNINALQAYKEENENDYIRTEYDCNSSSSVNIGVKYSRDFKKISLIVETKYDV